MRDVKDYVRHRRREFAIEQRRKYHRRRAAIEQRSPSDDEFEQYHAHYQTAVDSMAFDVGSTIRGWAKRGHEDAIEIWEDREIAGENGLKTWSDKFTKEKFDDPIPLDQLHELGEFLERLYISIFDLPEQPPVVDEPWSTDEIEPLADDKLRELGLDPDEVKSNNE